MSLQSLTEAEVFSPCSIEHTDVFMYDDEKLRDKCSQSGVDDPIYLDISANKSASFPHIKTDPYTDTLMSWTQKHPEHWSQAEFLDWIYSVASSIEVDPTTIRGEEFQNITGAELCRMTADDFLKRDPVNGRFFYDMFQSFQKDAFFIEPQCTDFTNSQEQYAGFHYTVKSEPTELRGCEMAETNSKLDNANIAICDGADKELQIRLGEFWYPVDISETKYPIDMEFNDFVDGENHFWPAESGYSSDSDGSDSSDMHYGYYNNVGRKNSTGSDMLSDDDCPPSLPTTIELQKPVTTKRKTAPQRKKPANGDPDKQQNRGRKPGQISKGNHLWEFIRDLLKDPRFNPQLLRWEEKDTGVFRFVQSEQVAKMWGTKKNNPGMTYEKLSRAMRFCRTAGYFAEVPKTGKFPKKLCFRFGPKAYGWSEE